MVFFSNVFEGSAASMHHYHPVPMKDDVNDLVEEEHQQPAVDAEDSHSSMIVLYHEENEIYHFYLEEDTSDWSVAFAPAAACYGLRKTHSPVEPQPITYGGNNGTNV